MAKIAQSRRFRPTLVSLAVASCFATSTALGNPTNPTVVHGSANFTNPAANVLAVTTATPQTIINWGSFSINVNELTRFLQPSAASAVLNRVVGGNPSAILGALQSNGRVLLVNPSGIVFGAGAQVDVAGLVATSLNLSNADFLANRLKFTETPGAGSVINSGNIAAGQVYLVGPAVTNNGVIASPKGEVVLAAGNSVELVNPGTPNLRVEISAADNEARNIGQIVSESGRIGIYAGLINNSGTIRADSVVNEGGRIVLRATRNTTLEAGSVTSASGATGGSVTIQSADTTLVAGSVEAKGAAAKGGDVQVLGNLVGLTGNANVDASGDKGGGTVLVGGDFQGKNPGVQNAFRTYVGANTTIAADAGTSGDGGKVIVWSDDATRAHGSISARGGAKAGDGGFVEVSGKKFLDFQANVNTSAPNGNTGTLLLDPMDVEIANFFSGANPSGAGFDSGGIFSGGTGTSQLSWSSIDSQLGSSNVIVTTTGTGGTGNITINEGHSYFSNNDLSLMAHKNIVLQSGVNVTNSYGGDINLYAGWNGNTATPAVPNAGDIILNSNAEINTGGNVLFKAGQDINLLGGNRVWAGLGNPGFSGARSVTFEAGRDILLGTASSVEATVGPSFPPNGATVSLTATTGKIDIQGSAVHASVDGGEGGMGMVSLRAGTTLTVNSSKIEAHGGDHFSAGGGDGIITLEALGGITIENSSVLHARGGAGGTGSGQIGAGGNANIVLCGGALTSSCNSSAITITDSVAFAKGGIGGFAGGSGGHALIQLTAGSGGIAVSGNALDPSDGDFSLRAVAGNGFGGGGEATISLTTSGGITVQGGGSGPANIEAAGGKSNVYLVADGMIELTNSFVHASDSNNSGPTLVSITGKAGVKVDGSTVSAYADSGNATVSLDAGNTGAPIEVVNGAIVSADGDSEGIGTVALTAGGSITVGGQVSTFGGSGGALTLTAGDKIIQSTGGSLFFEHGSGHTLSLAAVNGIGAAPGISTPAAPIVINGGLSSGFFESITAKNTGASGDIALQFPEFVDIHDASKILNANPTGTYYIQATPGEGGGSVNLYEAFLPGGQALLPGQNVHFAALGPLGAVNLVGISSGSITGAAKVTLEAGGSIMLDSGTSISATNVLLKSKDMDILGAVAATGGIDVQPFAVSYAIELGTTGPSASALALDASELSKLSAPILTIGTPDSGNPSLPASGAGPITFTNPVGPLGGLLNLYGSTITQTAGAKLVNPGGVAAFTSGDILLTEATNNFGVFRGASSGGNITVVNGGALGVEDVTASATNSISLTSTGDLTTTNGKNISGGLINLLTTGSGSKIVLAAHDISALATGLPESSHALQVAAGNGGDVTTAANLSAVSGRIALSGNNVTQVGGAITSRVDAMANNDIALSQANGHTLGTLAAGGTVAVTASAGDVLVDNLTSIDSVNGTTLTGKNVTQTGGSIQGLISATGTGGNVSLTQTGSYLLGALTAASGGSVTVNSGGSITDGNTAGNNITASVASLTAASGIGTVNDPLETQVGQLTLSSTGGEIGLANTGALIVNGVTFSGSDAAISAIGPLTLNGTNTGGPGTMLFSSNGGDLIVGSGATFTSGGSLHLTSTANVSLGGNLTTTGSAPGTGIELNASNAIVGNGGILQVGAGQDISLTAVHGIGALGSPVKLADGSGTLLVTNTGSTGNIVLSQLSGDPGGAALATSKVSNANPTGIYDLTAETGNWFIEGPLSLVVQVGAQQTITLRSPTGNIMTSGSGLIDAAGTVHLIAANGISANTSAGALSAHNTGTGDIQIMDAGGGTLNLVANAASGINESLRADSGNISLSTSKSISIGAPVLATGTVAMNSGGSITDNQTVYADITAAGASLVAASGIGSVANPLETQVGHIQLVSGGGEIGVINSGDLELNGLNSVGTAMVGSTGLLTTGASSSVTSGNLGLSANNGMLVTHDISASGDLTLDSGAGDLGIAEAYVMGTNVNLKGNNIMVGFTTSTAPTSVVASNLMKVTSAGNLNVLGGETSSAHALLQGLDVDLKVGTVAGFLNIHGGAATAQIHSVSPSTITVNFPTLDGGGYFVNGLEGVISDNGSGFFANEQPAVLGQNLIVTYGQVVPPVVLPPEAVTDVGQTLNQVIATTNQQNDLAGGNLDGNTGGGLLGGPGEEEEKKLPVCTR